MSFNRLKYGFSWDRTKLFCIHWCNIFCIFPWIMCFCIFIILRFFSLSWQIEINTKNTPYAILQMHTLTPSYSYADIVSLATHIKWSPFLRMEYIQWSAILIISHLKQTHRAIFQFHSPATTSNCNAFIHIL